MKKRGRPRIYTPEEAHERALARASAYRERNKEKIAANQQAYYERNKEKIAANQRARWRSRAEADPCWARQQLQPLYDWLATRCINTVPIDTETERFLADRNAIDPEEALLAECDRQNALDTIRDMLPDETFDILLALAENDMDVEATAQEIGLPASVIADSLALARSAANENGVLAA